MKVVLFFFSVIAYQSAFSQKNDTLKKYLDGNFSLTSRNKMVYPALAFKSNDHWVLHAIYNNNSSLLTAYFIDRDLTILDGPYRLYYPNKKLARSGNYQNGYRSGVWRYWYQNGQLRDSGAIVNNQLVGKWHSWDDNGNLLLVINYASMEDPKSPSNHSKKPVTHKSLSPENDELTEYREGRFTRYYPNGVVNDSGTFSNNKKEGLWKIWFENGQLEAAGHFANDSLHGEWTWYRETGTIATKENYRHHKLVSLQCFDENGKYTGEHCSILKPVVPMGNYIDFKNYMLDNIIMPKDLRNTRLEGSITIRCTITKDGKLTAITIDGCRYKSLETEIEKFFRGIKEWSPAILHNRPVDHYFEFVLPLSIPGS